MSLSNPSNIRLAAPPIPSAGVFAQVKSWFIDQADHSRAQRMAGSAFAIRVASAGVVFSSQVIMARWMGGFEFGIFVYAWTWLLLVGEIIHLGLPLAAQRFIPQYTNRGEFDLLRGFLVTARWLVLSVSVAAAALAAAAIWLFGPRIGPEQVAPLYLACAAVPAFALSILFDGTARSYNWVNLALLPHFFVRPCIMIALLAGLHAAGLPIDATSALLAVVIASWTTVIGQFAVLTHRMRGKLPPGPKVYAVRTWLATALPIIMVWGFYTLLTFTDVIVLQQFRPPDEVGLYYAATKTLMLVAFVYFSVAASVAHRFSACHVAGDHDGLAELVAKSTRWTFWPSALATLLVLAFGRPILWLFGPNFGDGYPLMFILAIGLMARASVGPAERLLNMLDQQKACAMVYAGAFMTNVAVCVLLAPRFGGAGAAIATSAALVVESTALFFVTKRRVGLHIFIWRPSTR